MFYISELIHIFISKPSESYQGLEWPLVNIIIIWYSYISLKWYASADDPEERYVATSYDRQAVKTSH